MPKHPFPLHIVNAIKGESIALVAGGGGFLGSRLCERLLENCRVVCLDNLNHGKRENIATSLTSEKFTFIDYDITKPLNDLLRKKVDYVFHTSGIDEAAATKKASLNDLLINTYGTRNLLEKAVSDKAKFLLVSTLEHEKNIDESFATAQAKLVSENITIEYVKKFGLDGRIVRVGHLFGPHMPLSSENPMSILVKDLLEKKEVSLANNELARLYPVFIDDCSAALLETMFGAATKGKIFNLISSRSITLLELSHVLKEVDPQYNLRFDSDGKKLKLFAKEHFKEGVMLSLWSKRNIVDELKETFSFFQKEKGEPFSIETRKENYKSATEGKKRFSPRFATMLFLVSAVLSSTVIPFLLLGLVSMLGIIQLNNAYKAVQEGNFKAGAENASSSHGFFVRSQGILQVLSYHFLLLQRQNDQAALFLLLKSGEDASLTSAHLADAATFLGEFFKKSINGEGLVAKPILDRAIGELNAASARSPILEKELEETALLPLPQPLREYIRRKQTLVSEYSETIHLARVFAALLPDLLGFDDKRTYLVLFQNNMELRPTGGFIGSYGILTFEEGSLSSFDVFDVYSADGQLKGHVDPPLPIRKYLNQPNWFLRDSNWDPNFQNAAAQAAWFLEKEVGIPTHGVIAVDVSFAQLILGAIGSVALPDYKETITQDNLFEMAETHSESGFFPGSTQKKDFLGTLNRRIIDSLLHEQNTPWIHLLSSFKKAVREKHVLFSFNNPAAQQIFNLNNWGGTLLSFEDTEGRFHDYRMINEANLGANKANLFIKRKLNDEIIIGKEGEVGGKLSIHYANDGPPTWPGGTYINYLRVFFPMRTKLAAVEIDGEEAGAAIDVSIESEKTVFGFLLSVRPRTSKLVSISYELPKPFPLLPGSNRYIYVFQKQPGTLEDPLSVMINYPQTLRIKNTNAQVFKERQLVTLSTDLSEDRLFEVEFLR